MYFEYTCVKVTKPNASPTTNDRFILPASALRCWRCSSDAKNAAFCDDTFDQTIITEQQRRWSYVECSIPPPSATGYGQVFSQRPVCMKSKQYGKSVERQTMEMPLRLLIHMLTVICMQENGHMNMQDNEPTHS